MTIRDILGVIASRWYTSLIAMLLAAGLTYLMLHDGGIYSTRTIVEFRWPGSARIAPVNGFVDDSMIAFAGAVAQRVNEGHTPDRYGTDEAPLYGAGRRESEFVDAAFVGSQFASAYPNAAVEVQVIGRTEADVKRRQHALVDEVLRAAVDLQDEAGATSTHRVTQEVRPLSWQIDYIAPSRLGRFAAFGAMAAAGVICGVGSALLWERAAVRVRTRNNLRGSSA